MSQPPVATHTLTPLLDDQVVLILVDDFLHRALQHPTLRPFYLRIDRALLRQKLAAFICQLFGGLAFDRTRMQRAHRALRLTDEHFDAVMEVLDQSFDQGRDGVRLVSWKVKVQALRDAEALRDEIIHPENYQLGSSQPIDSPRPIKESPAPSVERTASFDHVPAPSAITASSPSSNLGLPIPESEESGLHKAISWESSNFSGKPTYHLTPSHESSMEKLTHKKKTFNRCVQS